MSKKTINHNPLTIADIEHRSEAQNALDKMKALEKRKRGEMKTVKLKNGTIISSTSEENIKLYKDGRII